MDRISSLPDGVISHILSFLPLKKAALTSVLAKRWRILFAFSPNLDLVDDKDENRQSFVDFVDRVLAVSGNSPIKKFTLRCREGFEPAHINRWIRDVLNRGVLDLDLRLFVHGYSLPFEVFTCKTVVNLTLSVVRIDVLPEYVFLPALKTFFLYSDVLCGDQVPAFAELLLVFPVFENLVIVRGSSKGGQWGWNIDKRSRTS